MMALSMIFYDYVKAGKIQVEDITLDIVRQEVGQKLAEDKKKE